MSRYWLLLASLSVVIPFPAAGDDRPSSRLLHGICRTYAVSKTFTMTRYTNNDTEIAINGTCTFAVPAFQCGGYCETYAQPGKKPIEAANKIYILEFEERCKCCEAKTIEIRVPPNIFECQEDPTVKWDQEVVYETVQKDSKKEYCVCRTCRSSNVLDTTTD